MPASSDLHLRRAEPADLAALLDLELATFDYDRMSARQIRRHIASSRNVILLAEQGRELLGSAVVFFRRGARRARLYSIATAAAARGRGVAKALLAAVEALAQAHGMDALSLEVRRDNHAAVRLYETRGYRRTAALDHYYDDGASAWRYEKRLQDTAS